MMLHSLFLAMALVGGQTHPCDQAPPTTVTIASGAPYKVQFCSADSPEAMVGYVDGTAFDMVPVVARTATPSTTGYTLYESNPFIQVVKGQHQLLVRLYNRNALTGQLQLGDAMPAPFAFTAVDDTPKAAAPKIMGIIK